MRLFFYILLLVLTANISCSKGGNAAATEKPAPAAAILVSPASNSACLAGTEANGNQRLVTLQWNEAANAESYSVILNNLITNQRFSANSETNSVQISLAGNQPYSWYVVSKQSQSAKTAQSETWKFFLAGTPSGSYAPFPATAVSPLDNSVIVSGGPTTVSTVFNWAANDPDNDIASYAFYLDDKDGSTKIMEGMTEATITRSLGYHKTWFWKIITTDKKCNQSESKVFEVIVN